MKPKTFLFIGLAILAVSSIIIFWVVVKPLSIAPKPVYKQPEHQQCMENDRNRKMQDFDYDNKLNETETISLTYFCNILNVDYDRTFQTTTLLASLGGILLIIGAPLTKGGIIWLIVSKIKERRRGKKNF